MTTSSAGAVYLVAGNISFCGQCDVIPPTKQAFMTWPQKGLKGVDTHTQGERAWGCEQLSALKGALCLPNVSPKPDVWASVDKHLGDIWCFLCIIQCPRSSSPLPLSFPSFFIPVILCFSFFNSKNIQVYIFIFFLLVLNWGCMMHIHIYTVLLFFWITCC